ncbi:DNA polymerase II [Candidatus Woesearchaeota archaeon]|nr:DNA polymerase II [Candidatus Woesearchaeota archaeon]
MKGYIVYLTYRIVDDLPYIYLFGRLENNESFLAKTSFAPYFFIKRSDKGKAEQFNNAVFEESVLANFDGAKLIKVIVRKPGDVPDIKKSFEEGGIVCYEADIRFTQRFLFDNNIFGSIDITGKYQPGDKVDREYEEPKISAARHSKDSVRLKTLSIDIETNYDATEILSIALYSEKEPDEKREAVGEVEGFLGPGDVERPDGLESVEMSNKARKAEKETEVLLVSKGWQGKLRNTTIFETEKEMLLFFKERLAAIDPDIITGWNVVDFDLNVLSRRFKHNKIRFDLGRTEWESRVMIQHSFFKESSAELPGRVVLDGISLLKLSFIDLPNYKLDTAAEFFLNERKIQIENIREEAKRLISTDPQKLADYNLKDAELAYKIVMKKRLIDLTLNKALITGMPIDRVKGSVAALDSLYIRKARARGFVVPSTNFSDRGERVKGAFVMTPRPGVYDNVAVLDFKSLYPSIIRTYNIDPMTHDKKGTIIAPNDARFRTDDGVLPEIIEALGKERDKAKREDDAVRSNAIKIIMNSFYGVLANPMCRFYNLDMANAITSFGRTIVKETATIVEKMGYPVLYGDTDSVFIETKAKGLSEADSVAGVVARKINSHFDGVVRKKYSRRSHLVLEYEKLYKVFMLPRTRGAGFGAKKRYAGLKVEDGKEKMEITGMEFVRSDWTEIAKEFQLEMLEKVFHKKEVSSYIKAFIEEIRAGKHDNGLVYRKSIRKELENYVKTTPPHVKAARLLPRLDSNIIEYYMTLNGPVPVQLMQDRSLKLDYDHYIDKQIRPIAETILNLFGKSFDDIMAGKQKRLFEY